MSGTTGRIGSRLIWLVAAIAIALGAAGLVAGVDRGTQRVELAELAFGDDVAATARLDAIEAEVGTLADDVETLGVQARGALGAMVGGQPDTVDAAVTAGDAIIASIETRAARIATMLAAVPHAGTPAADLHLSPAVQDRFDRLAAASTATEGLADAWQGLTIGAAAAGRLAAQMHQHDDLVAEAAAFGRAAEYKTAIARLDEAAAVLKDSRAARDRMAATVDVSTLDEWLSRNETYDAALRHLYALSPFPSKITKKIRAAVDAEKAARDRLPPDSRGFTLIMGQIGQGGLNSAVIVIEDAKAALAAALASAPATP
jgi:hypothetical protein